MILETATSWLVTTSAQKLIENQIQKRRIEAITTLLEEMKGSMRSLEEIVADDEMFSLFLRFLKAVDEGAATRNLRLLAQIIRSVADDGDTNADRGIYMQNIVAELSEAELLLLVALYNVGSEHSHAASLRIKDEFVGDNKKYESEKSFSAALSRLQRTGLVYPIGVGGIQYNPSPLLDELVKLANIESF